ncbi:periplasmic/7TM domain sensor diguanylate cyclase [Vibrio hangzhouensis]|uniref:diguanylate cyclase n=2 Tax=Vibrio hangzhouensis TaxID=462991 RepID=A0A1H6C6U2_9VIBR|nr:periplasmic/7TM domain sensor diguanylate cyclase [Vibrio hangzhouensis]
MRVHKLLPLLLIFVIWSGCSTAMQPDNSTLVISNSKAWAPYSYLDQNNEPAGVLVDLWRAYGEANNVDIQFLLVDWQESIDAVKEGNADAHGGLMWSSDRSQYFDFGTELFEIDTQLYLHETLRALGGEAVLMGGYDYEIGVVQGGYEMEFLQRNYPSAKIVSYENNQRLLEAALSGRVSAFVTDLHVANYYLYNFGQMNPFYAAEHLYSGALYFAVPKANNRLLEALIPGFNNVTSDVRQRILSRWVHIATIYPRYIVPYTLLVLTAFAIVYYATCAHSARAKRVLANRAVNSSPLPLDKDALTGLRNGRFFHRYLDQVKHNDTSLSIIVVDIDNLMLINTVHGYLKGDLVIESIASDIRDQIAENCIFARIGGGTFALAYVDCDLEFSYRLSERLCRSVSALSITGLELLSLSVSIGCAVYEDARDFKSLSEADKLMYAAKRKGKNRAVVQLLPSSTQVFSRAN